MTADERVDVADEQDRTVLDLAWNNVVDGARAASDDPEWQQVRNKSEENGKLVEKVDSTFLVLTDFSAKVG